MGLCFVLLRGRGLAEMDQSEEAPALGSQWRGCGRGEGAGAAQGAWGPGSPGWGLWGAANEQGSRPRPQMPPNCGLGWEGGDPCSAVLPSLPAPRDRRPRLCFLLAESAERAAGGWGTWRLRAGSLTGFLQGVVSETSTRRHLPQSRPFHPPHLRRGASSPPPGPAGPTATSSDCLEEFLVR